MANSALDTSLLDKAIKFAVDAHAGTERRGKGFPYIVHPMEAVAIVATMTADQELLAAAALHDTVEDTDVTTAMIRAEFGDRVASLVDTESDKPVAGVGEKDSWRERKQAAIDRLASASHDAKIVAMGDKLSNMRAIANDYAVMGDRLWERFHAPGGKADHEWHYRGLAASLGELAGSPAYSEFTRLLEKVFGGLKPELIDMSEYEESGDGFTAVSYFHKDGRHMIKLYADFIPQSEPRRELEHSRNIAKMGISVPEACRLVTDGKRVGVEFERIVGKRSFARAISQEPENLESYVKQFAAMCRKLHSTKCDTTVFPSALDRFRRAVNVSKRFSAEARGKMLEFINSIPQADTCFHGDLHIGNAIIADSGEYWIDLSDFGYGSPLLDLGMFYFVAYGNESDEMCRKLFHISLSQMHTVWNVFVKEYFGEDADLKAINEMMAPYAALYMVFFDTRDNLLPGMPEYIEKYLINR